MAFKKAKNQVPTSIGDFSISVSKNSIGEFSALYNFEVLDQDGERIREYAWNLVPHLDASQQTSIVNFINGLIAKAENEVL